MSHILRRSWVGNKHQHVLVSMLGLLVEKKGVVLTSKIPHVISCRLGGCKGMSMCRENVTQYTLFSKSGRNGDRDIFCHELASCCSGKNSSTTDESGFGLKSHNSTCQRER